MESQNSPTSTYTAPTCTLKVSSKAKQLSHLDLQQPPHVGNFVLEIDHPDRGELERTTLQGDLESLENLQSIVSTYIADLIAKFPIPTTTDSHPPAQPQHLTETIVDPPSDRSVPTQPPVPPTSGLMQNLPGLRNSQPKSASETPPADRSTQSGHGKISKLIGFMNQRDRQNLPQSDLARSIPPNSVTPSPANESETTANTPKQPYLTGGNRSLDHQLHLGDLATPESGAVQILSAIQLFDLATVLDEYVATQVNTSQSGTKVHAQSLTAGGVKRADAEATAASLSRLPNLPRIPPEPEANPVYYRRRSRSGVMSALPWAAAAALLVGAPLLLFGSGSNNSFQEWAGKLKMPNLLASDRPGDKKTVGSRPTGSQPNNTITGADGTVGTNPSGAPSAALPKPWQAQSVQPPKTPPTAATSSQSGQIATNNLGTTTLPNSIAGTQAPTNPLTGGLGSTPSVVTTTPTVAAKPSTKIPTTATSKTTPVAAAKTNSKSKATPKANNTGNISLSTQPILLPQDLPSDRNPTPRSNQTAIPPQNTPVGGGINPPAIVTPAAIVDPYAPKKVTNPSVKPKIANKPRPQSSSSTIPFLTPSPTIEPKTYKANPNLITPQPSPAEKPIPPNNITGGESPTPQVVPDRPIQANNGQVGAEAIENSSLQEAKRYFQGKWKANPTQTNSLQYVLDVNGKNGVVRSVNPQGEAATDYLKQSKLIKPGQKIVSPVAGNSDQKIRVLLQPDGNVDTFVEP
jgi:Domain of unknown function (DUF4335)